MKAEDGEAPTMVLLEETMSVFEFLWDIAFALLVLRLAFFYYCLTFITGCILGFIRLGILVSLCRLREPMAELVEMPFMLLAIALWARFMVSKFEIPRVAWVRLAVGLLALMFLLVTEVVGRVIMYEEGWRRGKSQEDFMAVGAFTTSLIIFGLMPWILMLVEGGVPSNQESMPLKQAGSSPPSEFDEY